MYESMLGYPGSLFGQFERVRRELDDVFGLSRLATSLGSVAPYDPGRPCEIKVEYKDTASPAKAALKPGVEQLEPRTVVSRADDWLTAWRQFFF